MEIYTDRTSKDYADYIVSYLTFNNMSQGMLYVNPMLVFIQYKFIDKLNKVAYRDEPSICDNYKVMFDEVEKAYSTYGPTKVCYIYDNLVNFTTEEEWIIINTIHNCLEIKDVFELNALAIKVVNMMNEDRKDATCTKQLT